MEFFLLLIMGSSVMFLVYMFALQEKTVPHQRGYKVKGKQEDPNKGGGTGAFKHPGSMSFQEELALLGLSREENALFKANDPLGNVPFSMQAITPLLLSVRSWLFETFYAEQKRAQLRQSCLNDFPEMLDIMTLGLNAGLSFDSSLELYVRRYQSVLSRLLKHSLTVWKLGLETRAAALDYCAVKVQIPAFTRFSIAVAESLEFGMPLSETLMRQASEIRREQRLQVEEAIEKVPVKMLIPMGIFVVPAMLIAILGPLLSSALVVK